MPNLTLSVPCLTGIYCHLQVKVFFLGSSLFFVCVCVSLFLACACVPHTLSHTLSPVSVLSLAVKGNPATIVRQSTMCVCMCVGNNVCVCEYT